MVTADRVETSGIETRPMLIELSEVHKVYRTGKLDYPALRGVNLAIEDGDMVAIVGPSLEDLFVAPDWMRKGIATRLVDDLVDQALKDKVTRIQVTGNPHAYAFYRSARFAHLRDVDTRFGPGSRMELAVAGEDAEPPFG